MNARLRLAVVSASLIFGLLGDAAPAAEAVQELKEKVLASRSRIREGTLNIKTTIDVDTNPEARYERKVVTRKLVFHPEGVRVECHQVATVNDKQLIFTQRRILAQGVSIYDEMKPNIAVEVAKEGNMGSQATDDLLDPRVCGLVLGPIATWDSFAPEAALALWDRRPATARVEPVDADGLLAIKWEDQAEDRKFAVWLSPELGFAPLRAELIAPMHQAKLKAIYAQALDGTWFPSRVQFEEFQNEKVVYREVSEIEADFSTPVDEAGFTLESLGLPAGRLVRFCGRHMVFDGTKLVPEADIAVAEAASSPIKPRLQRLFLLMTGTAAAIGAAWLCANWIIGKAQNPPRPL